MDDTSVFIVDTDEDNVDSLKAHLKHVSSLCEKDLEFRKNYRTTAKRCPSRIF